MLFQSFFFILVFLPVAVIGWHFFGAFRNRAVAEWFLIGMSIWFYALFGVETLAVLAVATVAGYIFHILLWRARSVISTRIILAVAVILCVGLLIFYKLRGGAVPVGLSFYLFQLIAFLAERANGHLADITGREYLLYILYFPKLAQGPIALPAEIIDQFRDRSRRTVDRDRITRGLMLFIFGLAKKVLLADLLAPLVNFGFAQTLYLDTGTVLLVLFSYAFQLYFDFSGYCDMGMGVSRMLGIDLPANFDMPFQAANLRDFWKRWHATLSRFFVRYVYIPLGGSKRSKAFTWFNILLIFVLSGLWHGLGATYLVWGLINGLFVAISHAIAEQTRTEEDAAEKKTPARGSIFTRIRIYAAFLFTLVFFRAENLQMAVAMLQRFLIPLYPGFLLRTAAQLDIVELYPVMKAVSFVFPGSENLIGLILWVLILILCFWLAGRKNAREIAEKAPFTIYRAVGMGVLFAWSLLALNNVSSFLYFAY